MAPIQEVYELPLAAYNTLSDTTIKFELHCITFSHYCERARCALRLLEVPFKEVNYLTLAHIPAISKLQKQFSQGPCAPTASSRSPSVTPVLAIWTHDDKPLCLLQNSALIMRYAVLRAQALGQASQYQLYGSSGLEVDTNLKVPVIIGSGPEYEQISEMELRLSGTLGVEVRRVMYFYLLPRMGLGGQLFVRNSAGKERWLAWPLYFISRLLLPVLLKINKSTTTRGQQKLLAEFDYIDQILLKRQQQSNGQTVTSNTATGVGKHESAQCSQLLPYFLCGKQLSAADISLACLGGYIVGATYQQWSPEVDNLPDELKTFIKTLSFSQLPRQHLTSTPK
eukprot:GHUV01016753.1.p1 GENE.GHUV01016753.1~~GHUV01016753.1.p1  ORF type:complete len:339 (+),score=59.21 GHUV01016753.1:160-1176(+)